MSVRVMAWAWAQETRSSGQRLVLLALADTANDDGECWPGVERIAVKAALADKTVREHLASLEDDGLIARERRRRADGTLGTYTYRLAVDRDAGAGSSAAHADDGTPPAVDRHWSTGGGPAHHRRSAAASPPAVGRRAEPSVPEPSVEPITPPTPPHGGGDAGHADAFDVFWAAYPRRVGKPAALRAWRRMVGGRDVEAVMAGLDRWAAYWAARGEPEFIPHPATWLNQARWCDDPPPVPRRRPAGTVQATIDVARAVLADLGAAPDAIGGAP